MMPRLTRQRQGTWKDMPRYWLRPMFDIFHHRPVHPRGSDGIHSWSHATPNGGRGPTRQHHPAPHQEHRVGRRFAPYGHRDEARNLCQLRRQHERPPRRYHRVANPIVAAPLARRRSASNKRIQNPLIPLRMPLLLLITFSSCGDFSEDTMGLHRTAATYRVLKNTPEYIPGK